MNAKEEAIFDITLMAGALITQQLIDVSDSREFGSQIVSWAEAFCAQHEQNDWQTEDYLTAIDGYAESKLMEQYGITPEWVLANIAKQGRPRMALVRSARVRGWYRMESQDQNALK